jgi:hypothetical protein
MNCNSKPADLLLQRLYLAPQLRVHGMAYDAGKSRTFALG